MNGSVEAVELIDALDRARAVETFDQNLTVTAGAGTGKTTLLVSRVVHLLMRNPDPLKITEIVALTFTNKAANEMKTRLRERLQAYLEARLDREPATTSERKAALEVESLIARYQLSKTELDARAREALRNLERADIGTIHSFAATLLRLYPLEAGVDPQFQEDDGREFDRLFDQQWSQWLDRELSLESEHADSWRKILRQLTIGPIKELAKSLSCEAVELKAPSKTIPEAVRRWLADLAFRVAALIERHPEDRINERLLRAAQKVIGDFRRGALRRDAPSDEAALLLSEKSLSANIKGWAEDDLGEARDILRAARGLLQVDAELAFELWGLLAPFAERFRAFFLREGFISFDGLLIRARDLVRDNLAVREEIKRRYRSLLIDEFQDTDPIQYEILLYLAERPGSAAKSWREVRLAPAKIFIVGDPKQSIYAFRRADIEAYLEVVESIVLAQGGAECRLTTNFRSHAAILDAVNGIFASLMRPQQGLQPPYIPIYPAPERDGKAHTDVPRVLVRKVDADGGELDAERARRLEGESLAQWLKEEVLGKAVITNAQGEKTLAQPKDVALLFRKLTDIHEYLEPFRRHGIRYVVEGERHFYAAKEIIDAVNLLRAIDNPHDRIALVGVLRSPLGALTDCEIYELKQKNLLDYRRAERLDREPFPATLKELYRTLARLHEETRLMPVGSAVAHIFAFLPINLLAACAFHGEQAVANLEKLRQQAERLGREGLTTLKETIRQLERRVLEVKEEGESVLAEENLDAVRIMSVHKAKGLEFPIVVVAGCQAGSEARQTSEAAAYFDWSTGLTGLRCGPLLDPVGLYIGEKARLRAEAEQKRLLYVAITRAREHLVISCAPTERRSNGSFFAMLEETLGEDIKAMSQSQTIRVGEGTVVIEPIAQSLTPPGGSRSEARREQNKNWRPFIDQWAERRRRCESVLEKPLFVTPTSLKRREEEISEFAAQGAASVGRDLALAVGDLAHAFLEHWDFSADPKHFAARLTRFVDVYLPADLRGERDRILAELGETFQRFFASTIYRELSRASILGREVPLLTPWDGQIMEGVIDLIYERQGLLYLADYKTDRIDPSELSETASRYRQQAEVYTRAARLGLKREVAGFKLIFLRLGKAVEMIAPNGQLPLFEDENPLS